MNLALSIEEELKKLQADMEEMHIFHMTNLDEEMKLNLPGLMGKHKNRKITLDFVPWEEKKIFCVIYLTACFPFEISITQKVEQTQERFMRGRQPFSIVELSDPEFQNRWIVESYNAPLVKTFLEDQKNLNLIKELGDFERLTIDLKYLKFSKLLNFDEGIKAKELLRLINLLERLACQSEASCKI